MPSIILNKMRMELRENWSGTYASASLFSKKKNRCSIQNVQTLASLRARLPKAFCVIEKKMR